MAFDGNIDQPPFVTTVTNGKTIRLVWDDLTGRIAIGATESRGFDVNGFSRMTIAFAPIPAIDGPVGVVLEPTTRGLTDQALDSFTLFPGSGNFQETYILNANTVSLQITNNSATTILGLTVTIYLLSA